MTFVTFCGPRPSYSRNEQGFPIGVGRSLGALGVSPDCLASGRLARIKMEFRRDEWAI
jgi:hypothetical protein